MTNAPAPRRWVVVLADGERVAIETQHASSGWWASAGQFSFVAPFERRAVLGVVLEYATHHRADPVEVLAPGELPRAELAKRLAAAEWELADVARIVAERGVPEVGSLGARVICALHRERWVGEDGASARKER